MARDTAAFDALSRSLAPGERLQWSERPDPWTKAWSSAIAIPFGLFWLTITGSHLLEMLNEGNVIGASIVAIFVGIGLFILAAPAIEYRGAARTLYGITDRRLIIVHSGGRSLTSLRLANIGQVERRIRRNRTTIRIPTSLVTNGDGGHKVDHVSLYGLTAGDHAYRLLTQPPPSLLST